MSQQSDTIAAAFKAEPFRAQGHALVDALAAYLHQATQGAGNVPVLPLKDPAALLAAWDQPIPERPAAQPDMMHWLHAMLNDAIHLHHPRYIGHQVCSPLPAAALCDLVSALLNNGMAVYEMGQTATVAEHRVVEWMNREIGWDEQAGGFFTSGGSAGNLTALLVARQAKAGRNYWKEGGHGQEPLAVLVSEQAHYSVKRAVQIMGWGEDGAVPVASDAEYRMAPRALAEAYEEARTKGRRVIAVVANACSTATGSFDDLNAVADFCQTHDLWLHVDGAHGASILLSDAYRHLLDGIARADSVVWDAHKMMLMPALSTAVLFRDKAHSYQAFTQQASYLYTAGAEEEWYNIGQRTLECTKTMMAMKLYVCLMIYGRQFFGDYITSRIDLSRRFAEMVRARQDFTLAVAPDCNIVCFRYAPSGVSGEALDGLQTDIRQRLMASGAFYIVQTRLKDGMYLRVTVINPLTAEADLSELLDQTAAIGQTLLAQQIKAA